MPAIGVSVTNVLASGWLVEQVNSVLHIQVGVALYASAVFVAAHHHDLSLVEPFACHHADARVAQLMEPDMCPPPHECRTIVIDWVTS